MVLVLTRWEPKRDLQGGWGLDFLAVTLETNMDVSHVALFINALLFFFSP